MTEIVQSALTRGGPSNGMHPLLRVSGLSSGYGKLTVLRDIGFEVAQGEILGIVGPNGAGKSTLLKTLSGEISARAGRIELNGEDITRWSVRRRVENGLVEVPEGRELFPAMPVEENLELGAVTVPEGKGERLESILRLFPILRERSQQKAGRLSGGQQQMLAIGRGLMAKPHLLLLDEPTLGLAPKVVESLFKTLRGLALSGTTVVLVEQFVKVALRTADRCIVIRDGRIHLSGDSVTLSNNPQELHDAYFGPGGTSGH